MDLWATPPAACSSCFRYSRPADPGAAKNWRLGSMSRNGRSVATWNGCVSWAIRWRPCPADSAVTSSVRGGRLPPLLFNDDEAAAIVIGLRSAIDGSVTGLEESAVSALAKLDQILPAHVAGRVRALHESTASMLWHGPQEQVDAGHLILLAHACSAQEHARFDYVDKAGTATSRLIEPLRLVRSGWRWYLVAWDVDRADWRTFRLDRITNPVTSWYSV